MDFIEFKDLKVVPDPVHPYTDILKSSGIPIVIDNGSYTCRVGWANSENPLLAFKNVLAKPRKEKGKKDGEIMVGNDIANIETVRFLLKSQFDHNVVTHYEVQENILNYAFSHLGIDTEGSIDHPIAMTEAFANPNYCRMMMSELLFECYCVPAINFSVDSLLSFEKYSPHSTGLAIGLGYQCCHVVPIIDGRADSVNSRRLDIGGAHITHYMQRLLQLKYPSHFAAITLSRAEELIHNYGRIAEDYNHEVSLWEDPDYYDENVLRIQLPNANQTNLLVTSEQPKEKKREFTKRLMKARKREEKLAEDEEQLSHLMAIQDLQEEGDEEEFQKSIKEFNLSNGEELSKVISQIQAKIEKTRQKIVVANTTEDSMTEEPAQRIPKEEEEFKSWVAEICKKRDDILEKRALRKHKKQEMVKRRTPAAMERMRIISKLAKNEEDDFGLRDEDWDVYKTINKDGGDSESEGENEKLEELEGALRAAGWSGKEERSTNLATQRSLHLATERFRSPEALLQPSLLGSCQAGLGEIAAGVLDVYPPDLAKAIGSNIFLCGGPAVLPGLSQRILAYLTSCRPFKSPLSISMAPPISTYSSLSSIATTLPYLTHQEYMERGGDYLHPYPASNPYFPSPLPLAPSNNLPNFDEMEVEILS